MYRLSSMSNAQRYMPYDPIQGQGQGHECLKATQEESTVSTTWD